LKIVIDTNILFSYFWKNSITKKIIESNIFELYTPNFAFDELAKYKSEIIYKVKITEKEYNQTIKELNEKIIIVDPIKYSQELRKVTTIPDVNDIDFIALSMYLDKILWTNDNALTNQDYALVLNTKQILYLLIKLSKLIDN